MPSRSPKMKRRILGFQRRVWWPKCTPASSSSLTPISGTLLLPIWSWYGHPPVGFADLRAEAGRGPYPAGTGIDVPCSVEAAVEFAPAAQSAPIAPWPGAGVSRRTLALKFEMPNLRAKERGRHPRAPTRLPESLATCPLKRSTQVLRQRRAQIHRLARDRVGKGQPLGVEKLAGQSEAPGRAVQRVPRHRVADGRQVHADLVRPACLESDAQQ